MLSQASAIVADAMKLIDTRTQDGSRHFATLPQVVTWGVVCDHILLLPDARMINFVADWPARAWLDFQFRGHRFAINARDGLFQLFVCDPQCPDLVLFQVGSHFERLINEAGKRRLPPLRPVADDEGAVA